MSRRTIRCPASWARAGEAARARPAITRDDAVSRMLSALLFEARRDARRAGLVAFTHFIDQRHGVLQQADLGLEPLDQALLRRLAGRLRSHRRAALADRLVDDGEVL